MTYNSAVIAEIEKIYNQRRKKAESIKSVLNEKLFSNPNYLNAYNEYNSIRFEISKAKFIGDSEKLALLQTKLKELKSTLLTIRKDMGISEEDYKVKYKCSLCNDTGKTADGLACNCFKKLLSKLTLESLGLERKKLPKFEKTDHLVFNDLEKIHAKMQEYCNKFPDTNKNIVISGSVGTGKSHLAGCIANEIISKEFNVVYISACELNSILLKYHTAPVDDKGVYLDLLINCDLLVIDDLGSEPIYKNVTEEYLLMIITERALKENPFVITTNLSQEQLLDRYGDRTLSRLNDKKRGVFIQINGEDLRRKRK